MLAALQNIGGRLKSANFTIVKHKETIADAERARDAACVTAGNLRTQLTGDAEAARVYADHLRTQIAGLRAETADNENQRNKELATLGAQHQTAIADLERKNQTAIAELERKNHAWSLDSVVLREKIVSLQNKSKKTAIDVARLTEELSVATSNIAARLEQGSSDTTPPARDPIYNDTPVGAHRAISPGLLQILDKEPHYHDQDLPY
jgi:predicted  nucleic acid-binding Zn-ribbon protein